MILQGQWQAVKASGVFPLRFRYPDAPMAENVFRVPRASNGFDQLCIDVPALYERYPLAQRTKWPGRVPARSSRYAIAVVPLRSRVAAWKLAHCLHLDLEWLRSFERYWINILGGRPLLSPEDFHFLRGIYRMRHQDNQVPDSDDTDVHVAAWQQPELIYQLFAQINLEQLHPRLGPAVWLHRVGARSFCEYGCATAPVATAYREFFGKSSHAYLVDLPTLALHYAAFKFAADERVEPIALTVASRLLPPDIRVHAIVCVTVFEHLLDPLRVAHRFADMLKPGGHLIFDYHAGQGAGLDTRQGVEQRDEVLRFITDRFTIVDGDPKRQGGALLTIARLK
jgi:SAM-dependent methyltransferase